MKHTRKLAEVRPKAKWRALTLYLDRRIDDPRIARTMHLSATRTINEVKTARRDRRRRSSARLAEAYEGSA